MSDAGLRITEIFYSLQGEALSVGLPTVFVRLTGCPLRCHYCDSEYAFHGGERMSIEDILEEVGKHATPYVCVTGGEPLAQPNCFPLLSALTGKGYQVSLETSGAMPVESVDKRVSIVLDLKTPGSGEQARNRWENLEFVSDKDQIKFVLCDRKDYEWARFIVDQKGLRERVGAVLFSPCYESLPATDLANWILEDKLNVRFQMQLHKQLWGDVPGV